MRRVVQRDAPFAGLPQSPAKGRIPGELVQGPGERVRVLRRDEEARLSVDDDLGRRADPSRDDRQPRGHRFQIDDPEAFLAGGQAEDVGRTVLGGKLLEREMSPQHDARTQPGLLARAREALPFRTISHDPHAGGRPHARGRLDQRSDVLARIEVRHAEDRRGRSTPVGSPRQRGLPPRRVEEFGNDPDPLAWLAVERLDHAGRIPAGRHDPVRASHVKTLEPGQQRQREARRAALEALLVGEHPLDGGHVESGGTGKKDAVEIERDHRIRPEFPSRSSGPPVEREPAERRSGPARRGSDESHLVAERLERLPKHRDAHGRPAALSNPGRGRGDEQNAHRVPLAGRLLPSAESMPARKRSSGTGAVRSYYRAILPFYEEEVARRRDLDFWVGLCRRWKPRAVLEVGCGLGVVTEAVASRAPTVGVDLSIRMLHRARARLRRARRKARLLAADVRRLALTCRFDLVLAPGAPLSHWTRARDREAALRAVARHLTKDGRFVLDGLYRRPGVSNRARER